MSNDKFKNLNVGDIIKSLRSGETYVVMSNYGNRVTAVRSVDVTNPSEWSLVRRVGQSIFREKEEAE